MFTEFVSQQRTRRNGFRLQGSNLHLHSNYENGIVLFILMRSSRTRKLDKQFHFREIFKAHRKLCFFSVSRVESSKQFCNNNPWVLEYEVRRSGQVRYARKFCLRMFTFNYWRQGESTVLPRRVLRRTNKSNMSRVRVLWSIPKIHWTLSPPSHVTRLVWPQSDKVSTELAAPIVIDLMECRHSSLEF